MDGNTDVTLLSVVKDFRYPLFWVCGFDQRRTYRMFLMYFRHVQNRRCMRKVIFFRISLPVVSPSMNIWLKQNSENNQKDPCSLYPTIHNIPSFLSPLQTILVSTTSRFPVNILPKSTIYLLALVFVLFWFYFYFYCIYVWPASIYLHLFYGHIYCFVTFSDQPSSPYSCKTFHDSGLITLSYAFCRLKIHFLTFIHLSVSWWRAEIWSGYNFPMFSAHPKLCSLSLYSSPEFCQTPSQACLTSHR